MKLTDRFIRALLGLKPRKRRTIFDDIADARRKAGLPPAPHLRKWT